MLATYSAAPAGQWPVKSLQIDAGLSVGRLKRLQIGRL
jgi:hypothetical protein